MKQSSKNNNINNILLNNQGAALITVMIFISLLVTLGIVLLTMSGNDTKMSTIQRDSTKAFYQAESGIDKALWYLNTNIKDGGKGLDWRITGSDNPFKTKPPIRCEIWVEDEPEGQTEKIKITSKGLAKDKSGKVLASRTIEVKVQKISSSDQYYKYALAAKKDINLMGRVKINGNIHSNKDINAYGNCNLRGIAFASGIIMGNGIRKEQCEEGVSTQDYPEINFQYYKELAIDKGTYYNKSINYDENKDITRTGIYFVDGDINISGNTKLSISNGAIFATGDINIFGNASVEVNNDFYDNPLNLAAKGDIKIRENASFDGSIIQSNGDFNFSGRGKVKAISIIADKIDISNNITVNYKGELKDKIIKGVGEEFYKKISWREIY